MVLLNNNYFILILRQPGFFKRAFFGGTRRWEIWKKWNWRKFFWMKFFWKFLKSRILDVDQRVELCRQVFVQLLEVGFDRHFAVRNWIWKKWVFLKSRKRTIIFKILPLNFMEDKLCMSGPAASRMTFHVTLFSLSEVFSTAFRAKS